MVTSQMLQTHTEEDKLGESGHVFNDSDVNIIIEGKRHLSRLLNAMNIEKSM